LFAAVAIGIWLLVHRTTFGRSWRAIGFAPEGARYAGIPVRQRVAMAYVLAGVIAGLAAVIYTARLGQAKADAGTGYELFAITAVVLGGTSIFGGVGSVHGTMLGVGAIAVLSNGLVHARQPREVAGMLTGTLLLVALAASVVAKQLAARRGIRHAREHI
jgi:rhamnose transport system permease protein